MSRLRAHFPVFVLTLLAVLATAAAANAQQKLPDSTLYTLYNTNQPPSEIGWETCGMLGQQDNCYGSGNLGPFANACGIQQSPGVALNTSTVIRYIYVFDAGSSPSAATLYIYKRTDFITLSGDLIHVNLAATVPLPTLVAGSGASCLMVQNPADIFVATQQGSQLVAVDKTTYVADSSSQGANLVSLTADNNGFVVALSGSLPQEAYSVFGPDGQQLSGGAGTPVFLLNPINAINPQNYPAGMDAKPTLATDH
jgi:hypothetical protein